MLTLLTWTRSCSGTGCWLQSRGPRGRLARALPKLLVPARHHTTYCPRPSCLGVLLASFPRGKTEARGGQSLWGPGHVGGVGDLYSLCRGQRSLAWPSGPWWPGAQGDADAGGCKLAESPSTCTGMALDVVSSTSRHCVSRSPCHAHLQRGLWARELRVRGWQDHRLSFPRLRTK